MTLAAVAEEVGASASSSPAGTEFKRGTSLFAFANGDVAEFKLDQEIADAALGTPETAPSGRGPAWVKLAPASPIERDQDRARAWFLSAWRATENA